MRYNLRRVPSSEVSYADIFQADSQDPNWKENYYGVNYDALLKIKQKYDPDHVFYALTAVGSDYWVSTEDGRLCRTGS